MANTTNIDLVKPAGTDHALVSVLNANSDKIDAEAGNVRSNFALVQNTNTATQAISKDQLVVWKGVLKKATSNIANGATLSNSNLTDTKVSTELASLSDQIAKNHTYYNANTDCTVELNRTNAMSYLMANVFDVVGSNTANVRYQSGYIIQYLYFGFVTGNGDFIMETNGVSGISENIILWKKSPENVWSKVFSI